MSTPHTLATDAAAAAFDSGGNAIDAAVRAATTLAVVYPHMCGVGGDLFALVRKPSGEVVALNASGRAPTGADPAAAALAGDGAMPLYGPHTVTVPGAVSGWAALHGLGATLPWPTAFTESVALARDGFPVPSSLARTLVDDDARLAADPGVRSIFFDPQGSPRRAHDVVGQPALSQTLQALADQGPSAWYGGTVGARYAQGLAALGVPITTADLAAHTADLGQPLRGRYRDLDLFVHPPNSPGFVLLEILALVERMGLHPDPLGPDAGLIAGVFRAASDDRDRHLADADHMRIDVEALLGTDHLTALAGSVSPSRQETAPYPRQGTGDTIALVTADHEGRAVSLIQSLFDGFGAGILEPTTGVVAHNRGACFTVDPDHPNSLEPGKRPAHTLTPVLVQRDGRLAGVAGTMGGLAQPQINTMTLLRAFDLRRHPAEAVAEPRWVVQRTQDPSGAGTVLAEAGVSRSVVSTLRNAGYRVETVESDGHDVGHAHLIVCEDGTLRAGCDPRSDGGARGA